MRARSVAAAVVARALFLGPMRRRPRNRIVLLGRRMTGNHAAFAAYLAASHPEIEVVQLGDSPRIRDLAVAARARAIVSAGGPSVLRRWVSSRNRPLFVDAWHGVGFKSRITRASDSFKAYDAHFVSSPFVGDYYRRSGAAVAVTGYARMDALAEAAAGSAARDRVYELFTDGVPGPTDTRSPIILFAPTWGVELAEGLTQQLVLDALNDLAGELGFFVAFRPHPDHSPPALPALERVRLLAHTDFEETAGVLAATDVLLTDWSSIATDFLPLARPVIYLDADPPARPLGPLDETDRVGEVVSTITGLRAAVAEAIADRDVYVARFEAARLRTVERAWGSTIDGKSSARYLTAIEDLERSAEKSS